MKGMLLKPCVVIAVGVRNIAIKHEKVRMKCFVMVQFENRMVIGDICEHEGAPDICCTHQ